MQTKKIIVNSEMGLHARPAAIFIKEANRFKSNILITKGNATVNAKSIMGVMALSVGNNDEVELRSEGEDEEEAIDALSKILENGIKEG